MDADLALLIQTYERAIEARLRYVYAQSAAGLELDAKVDHVLMNHITASEDAVAAHVNPHRPETWKRINAQVCEELGA